MSEVKIKHTCPYCGTEGTDTNNVGIPWPVLIKILCVFFVIFEIVTHNFQGKYVHWIVDICGFIVLYYEYKKYEHRWQLNCDNCGRTSDFYADDNGNPLVNLDFEDKAKLMVLKTATKIAPKSTSDAIKEGVATGIKTGLTQNIMISLYRTNMSKTIEKVFDIIVKERYSNDIDSNKLKEISENLRNFIFSESQKRLSTVMQQKYPDLSIKTHEELDKFVNNNSIPEKIKDDVTLEYCKIIDDTIKKDLGTYVKNKYGVSIESVFENNTKTGKIQ